MISIISAAREQVSFMPHDLNEWLPEDHLVSFLVDIVSEMDLSQIYASYSGKGSTPYDPKLLLALIFMANRQAFIVRQKQKHRPSILLLFILLKEIITATMTQFRVFEKNIFPN